MHPIHERILDFIGNPDDASFGALALDVFAHQYDLCEPYRRHCQSRGQTPSRVREWYDVPPVPIQAFKHVSLSCAAPERTFFSTGTTAGPDLRSRHGIPDLRLYRRAAAAGMRRFLLPDVQRIRVVSLVPRAVERPDSSLAQMVAWTVEDFGTADSNYVVREGEVDVALCIELLKESERGGSPVCIMTTTAALIRFIDALAASRITFRLPHGSRLMDTGGDKGSPRPMSRNGLLHACWNTFAIPGYFCVNEYGMTELSSQYYDNVIAERHAGRHRPRRKSAPPWLRTLALDPTTLNPVPAGERGLLCHFDLANAGTAMAILTEDLGRVDERGLELLGRATGAEARGCSMGIEEWREAGGSAHA